MYGTIKSAKAPRKLKRIVFSICMGGIISVVLTVILLYAAAGIFVWNKFIPEDMLGGVVTVVLCIAAIGGGGAAAKLSGTNGLVCGLACSGLFSCAVWFTGTYMYSPSVISASSLIKCGMILLCGAIAGMLAVNQSQKVKF